MKVTKKMLNVELQWKYWPLKISAFIMSKTWAINLINLFEKKAVGATIPDLNCDECYIPSRSGGPDIRVRIFKPLNSAEKLPGMLYLHGGGYVMGSPDSFLNITKRFILAEPCVMVAPDYRRALESPYPAAFDDCYDTLLWMNDNAEMLGVIPDKFVVTGHSAGGGLAAAVTLKATDTQDVKIAFQMPIYPMIDDRQNTPSATNNNAPVWNSIANKYAWSKYLRGLNEKNAEIPLYAAAARATDYSRLPPTITFVGELEPFRDETMEYVENLKRAGVPTEFKLFKGCFHAFEVLAPEAKISKEAWAFVFRSYSEYMNKYIYQ
jgi:acetyl esterase/lipase